MTVGERRGGRRGQTVTSATHVMTTILNIPYTPTADPCHRFDLYLPDRPGDGSPVLAFVHGGAWRREDKADHHSLACALATATHCPVLVPNYRLTPQTPTESNQFRHPGHAEDILAFLEFVTAWDGLAAAQSRSFYLLGHSAGAHILASIFLDSSAISPSLAPSARVLRGVQGLAVSEGIYDLDLLLERFPEYSEWFIAAAFGKRDSYTQYSATRLALRKNSALRWMVIHSTGDTLVDVPQSDAMYRHLRILYGAAADDHVAHSFDKLHVEHNDVLLAPEFVSIVRSFVGYVQ
ncbi:Alpha/Beta hydrolase protein [Mycena sp. CBHHK59/15]|nr:Alpha/Beta hydrolase protein [Mycena sp. CBHHK59/15]